MSKLEKLAQKLEPDLRAFTFRSLLDAIKAKDVANSSVSRAYLVGDSSYKSDAKKVPFVTLCAFKWKARLYLVQVEMPKEQFEHAETAEIAAATADHDVFRRKVAGTDDSPAPDVHWQGRLRPSTVAALRIIQDLSLIHI
jgi:hypothetical protein